MGSVSSEKTVTGYAAHDASGILTPFTYTLRRTGPEDVLIKVLYCGICHTDIHQTKNHLGMSKYPMVPGGGGGLVAGFNLNPSKFQTTTMAAVPVGAFCSKLPAHEVVGEVVEVGSDVTRFHTGDTVGVGVIVGCCRTCGPCKANIEQYCSKRIWSYNDVYTDGKPTQGGFASAMVVDQKFVVKIPAGLAAEQVGPLLCAGLTVYSPLKHFGLMRSGLKGGILGLGGVGHMGVKMAKAMGHHVTVISSSDRKRTEAMEHLGADAYLVSSDEAAMGSAAEGLDYIIDTVPVFHPLEPYLSLLKVDGQIILMGVINQPMQFITPMIMLGRKSISGSFIGSMTETEEMLEFCEKKGLSSMIEIVKLDQINEAVERLERNDVRYRFVVDVAGSKQLHDFPPNI